MKPYAIVLDVGETGYGIIRCLGSECIPIIGVHNHKSLFPVGKYSKYVKKTYFPEDNYLLPTLEQIASKSDHKPVLFPSSDTMVSFIAENAEQLKRNFKIPSSEKYDVNFLLNKDTMYEKAASAGLNIIPSVSILTKNDLAKLEGIELPAFVKSRNSLMGYKEFMSIHQDRDSLATAVKSLLNQNKEIMVSKYIKGPVANFWSADSVLLSDGKPVVCSIRNYIRQSPTDEIGSCVLAKTEENNDVYSHARNLSIELGIKNAVISFDMKQDEDSGIMYFIEANYRSGAPVLLSKHAGTNAPHLVYLDAIGQLSEAKSIIKDRRPGVKWWSITGDYDLMKNGKLSMDDMLATTKGETICSHADPDDPLPFAKTFMKIMEVGKR